MFLEEQTIRETRGDRRAPGGAARDRCLGSHAERDKVVLGQRGRALKKGDLHRGRRAAGTVRVVEQRPGRAVVKDTVGGLRDDAGREYAVRQALSVEKLRG